MSATVTVVVRTRNRPAMLTRALASIASQTFDDYEVVIVNDAGDEAEVREIVKKQKSAVRSKIAIVTNEVSNGREAALESGLAASPPAARSSASVCVPMAPASRSSARSCRRITTACPSWT